MGRNQDDYALLNMETMLGKVVLEMRGRHQSAQRTPVSEELLTNVRNIEQGITVQPGMATLRAAQGEEIERLSLIDQLTELYNTKTFFKELKDEIKRAVRYHRAVSLCVISIDGLGELVQQYGALTGDAVLKIAANVVRATIAEKDIPSRYTHDKFAVIFPEMTAAQVALTVERIRQRIGIQAISHNWQNLKVTASIGLASYPAHAQEYDTLIASAEEVLSLAVERGGDRVCMV